MKKALLTVAIVAALALWLASGPILRASGGLGARLPVAATPTRAPTPALGETMSPPGTPIGPPGSAPPPDGCVMRGGAPPGSVGSPPPFVDGSLLAKSGFAERADLSEKPPCTPALTRVSPLRAFGPDRVAHGWEKRESLPNGASGLTRLEIGADGRVVFSRVRLTDRDGVVLSESWRAYGPLGVYDPSSVPDRVFSLSQAGRGACPDAG
ncbi:MAG: hypothetical protein ACRDIY_08420 [Chloroflexota bacterium]